MTQITESAAGDPAPPRAAPGETEQVAQPAADTDSPPDEPTREDGWQREPSIGSAELAASAAEPIPALPTVTLPDGEVVTPATALPPPSYQGAGIFMAARKPLTRDSRFEYAQAAPDDDGMMPPPFLRRSAGRA